MLLCLAAAIWGFGFVAQRLGMEHLGPYAFNALRFFLGALVLLPCLFVLKDNADKQERLSTPQLLLSALIAGVLLFGGASLQQLGLVSTTAGNAAFVTGLYLIFVPLLGLCFGQRSNRNVWLGACLAVIGLYALCVTDDFSMRSGDVYVLCGAVLWAGHVLYLSVIAHRVHAIRFAALQFSVCALLSLFCSLGMESTTWALIVAAKWALLFAGVLSVGLAYTLQVVGQKGAHPAQAAIILSLESVFGVVGGYLFLSEELSLRGCFGCVLMFAGMLLSQLRRRKLVTAGSSETSAAAATGLRDAS